MKLATIALALAISPASADPFTTGAATSLKPAGQTTTFTPPSPLASAPLLRVKPATKPALHPNIEDRRDHDTSRRVPYIDEMPRPH